MVKKTLRLVMVPVLAAIAFVSFSSFTEESESSGGGVKCSDYCEAATDNTMCRITITYSNNTQEVIDCVKMKKKS